MDHKTKFWAAHVTALKVAAIDASEYARRHDLAVKSLYYWRRKLEGSTQAHQTDIKAILKKGAVVDFVRSLASFLAKNAITRPNYF